MVIAFDLLLSTQNSALFFFPWLKRKSACTAQPIHKGVDKRGSRAIWSLFYTKHFCLLLSLNY